MATKLKYQGVEDQIVSSSLHRQAIINGNFDVAQRGTTFAAGDNNDDVYTLDRWNLISDGNDVLDVSQTAITDLTGSSYAIKLDVETSARGGIVQFIENKDASKLKGKYVSVSFAVKSANISAIRCAILSWGSTADSVTSDVVGTWGDTPTWATNWTAENTPADLTVTSSWTTVKVENIYIDSATVNNIALAIWIPNAETIGDIVYISQVQMNEGSVALPFQPKSFAEELRACQRYYYKSYPYATYAGNNYGISGSSSVISDSAGMPVTTKVETASTSRKYAYRSLPVEMRNASQIKSYYDIAGNISKVTSCNSSGQYVANNITETYQAMGGNAKEVYVQTADNIAGFACHIVLENDL